MAVSCMAVSRMAISCLSGIFTSRGFKRVAITQQHSYHSPPCLPLALTRVCAALLCRIALILAKQLGFDAFTALGIGGSPEALKSPECKFVIGTGILRYYLFNWQGLAMHEDFIGFVAL